MRAFDGRETTGDTPQQSCKSLPNLPVWAGTEAGYETHVLGPEPIGHNQDTAARSTADNGDHGTVQSQGSRTEG